MKTLRKLAQLVEEIKDGTESITRSIKCNRVRIWEYISKNADYQSCDISVHNVDRNSFALTTKELSKDNGDKFSVQTITFKTNDGMLYEIALYS